MPLDSRKAAHIQTVLPRTWAGRQKTITLVTAPGGTRTYTAAAAVFRPQVAEDPTVPAPARHIGDMVMLAPMSLDLAGVLFIADTPTATEGAVAAAPKYEIIERLPVGILPDGTHQYILLRRLR